MQKIQKKYCTFAVKPYLMDQHENDAYKTTGFI